MQDLKGRRVVVTGGSQGPGLAMVEALVACGARVTAIGRDRVKLRAAEQAGAAVVAYRSDLCGRISLRIRITLSSRSRRTAAGAGSRASVRT